MVVQSIGGGPIEALCLTDGGKYSGRYVTARMSCPAWWSDHFGKVDENCRFWSQMVAQSIDGGPVEVLCLAADSPYSGRYTTGIKSCPAWRPDRYGKVEDPPDYGELSRAAYEAEEANDD